GRSSPDGGHVVTTKSANQRMYLIAVATPIASPPAGAAHARMTAYLFREQMACQIGAGPSPPGPAAHELHSRCRNGPPVGALEVCRMPREKRSPDGIPPARRPNGWSRWKMFC